MFQCVDWSWEIGIVGQWRVFWCLKDGKEWKEWINLLSCKRESLECKEDILVGVLWGVGSGHWEVNPEPAGQKIGFWWGLWCPSLILSWSFFICWCCYWYPFLGWRSVGMVCANSGDNCFWKWWQWAPSEERWYGECWRCCCSFLFSLFWNRIRMIGVNECVCCRWSCSDCGAKIGISIGLMRHGDWRCCRRLP